MEKVGIFAAIALIAVLAIAITFFVLKKIDKGETEKEQPRRKNPLTANEAAMYNRLMEALPGAVLLAQVSFSALLTAKSLATRARFNRKMADFVVCDREFNVVAVVELDDSSHNGREAEDAQRDALLTQAGYRVLRYRGIPKVEKILSDFGF